ncbi:hypothetical protein J2046_006749 [Rhizobium petrolearium]|nr:hypothetical protein [Neorhizobium petrolearium]
MKIFQSNSLALSCARLPGQKLSDLGKHLTARDRMFGFDEFRLVVAQSVATRNEDHRRRRDTIPMQLELQEAYSTPDDVGATEAKILRDKHKPQLFGHLAGPECPKVLKGIEPATR